MAGEIATAFVRIRPVLPGFKQTVTAGVKEGLVGAQEEINASAKANVAASAKQIEANRLLAASYKEIAASAVRGSDEQIAATRLAARASEESAAQMVAATERAGTAVEGLKAKTVGLGAAFGVAFGAVIAVDFVKSLAEDAAKTQKSVEVIKDGFGKASEAVLKFGETGAKKLGIATYAADQTSARFAILFKNLGIGAGPAAKMTVNLEKLAGSLSSIRGVDPSIALRSITLAMLGNVRSLKQLGVSVDPVTEKYLALKEGLITAGQALSPAAKAIVIYQIATQNLNRFQAQAAAHANDLANVNQRLAASWQNAKDKLGEGLLPIAIKAATFFTDILPGAVNATKLVFGDLADEVSTVAGAIAKAIPESLIKRLKDISAAFKTGGAGGGFAAIVSNFKALSPAAKVAVAAIGAVTAALVVMFAAAFPITAIIIGVVALGVAFDEAYKHSAKFRDIVHEVGRVFTDDVLPAIKKMVADATPAIAAFEADVAKAFEAIKAVVMVAVRVIEFVWQHFGDTIKTIVHNDFAAVITVITAAFKIIGDLFDTVKDVFTGKWGAAWGSLKDIVSTSLGAAEQVFKLWVSSVEALFSGLWKNVEKGVIEGVAYVTNLLSKVPTSFHTIFGTIGFKNPFKAITAGLKAELADIDAASAAKKVAQDYTQALADHLQYEHGNPALTKAAQDLGAKIAADTKDGATGKNGPNLAAQAAAAAAKAAAAAAAAKLQKAEQHAKDAYTTAASAVTTAESSIAALKVSLAQAIATEVTDVRAAVENAKSNLLSIGSSLASSMGTVLDQPFVLAGQKIQDAQDKLSLLFDSKSAKLQAQAAKIQQQQSILSLASDKLNLANLRREIALPGGKQLSTDPKVALAELNKLARTTTGGNKAAIDAFILQYKSATLQVAGDKIGLKQQTLDAKRTTLQTALQLKQELLTVEQDTANRLKTQIARQIADLTNAFNRHVITYAKFKKGIEDIIAKGRPAFKKAGVSLGTAFADQYVQQATDIIKQAGLIAHGPQRPGTTGQDTKLINPLAVLRKDQAAVDKIRTEIGNKQVGLAQKILKENQKHTTYLAALAASAAGHKTSKAKNPGDQSSTSKHLTATGN